MKEPLFADKLRKARVMNQEDFREATKKEVDSVNKYVESISKPTEINFYELVGIDIEKHCKEKGNK